MKTPTGKARHDHLKTKVEKPKTQYNRSKEKKKIKRLTDEKWFPATL